MVVLMESILCFGSPLAVLYGFHARRKAPERVLAWIGLVLSLVVFVPFVMAMIAAVLNAKDALCR
jgi:hypothetical protein